MTLPSEQALSFTTSPAKFIEHERQCFDGRELHVVTVSGTYYDMGKMLGLAFAKEIQADATSIYASIKRKISIFLKNRDVIEKQIDDAVAAFHPRIPWACQQEMLGVLSGCKEAGYEIADTLIFEKLNALIEVGERACSLFAAQPPLTNGHTFQLRDLDYYTNVVASYTPVIVVRIPQNARGELIDVAYATFDFIPNGFFAATTGVNAAGVAFSQSRAALAVRYSDAGMPLRYLLQQILSRTRTARQAVNLVRGMPPATAHFAIISDPQQKDDSLQLLFMGPEVLHCVTHNEMPDVSILRYDDAEFKYYTPMVGAVYWTDMPERKVDGKAEALYLRDMHRMMCASNQPLDAAYALTLAKQLGNDTTHISVLYDTTELLAWAAFSTRKVAAHQRDYFAIDLKKYFALKNRVGA